MVEHSSLMRRELFVGELADAFANGKRVTGEIVQFYEETKWDRYMWLLS
jgi:hypothetical protein